MKNSYPILEHDYISEAKKEDSALGGCRSSVRMGSSIIFTQ